MAYDGAGTYSAPASSWNPAVAATDIDATDWIALLADMSTALSLCVLKDGQQVTTAVVPFTAGLSIGGINQVNRRAAVGVSTAWDPSDVIGTLTKYAGSTVASSSTAVDYITFALAAGVWTFTCVKAGSYRFIVRMQNEVAAAATVLFMHALLSGTASPLLGDTTEIGLVNCAPATSDVCAGTAEFYAVMTAGQTVIIQPQVSVNSAGVTTNFTTQATVSAEYTGT